MLSYRQNQSTAADILKLLIACDRDFIPPLSERVDLPSYAARMAENAALFEGWDAQQLVAVVAIYCNAPDRSQAFVTNVSVAPQHRGSGVSRNLLTSAIEHVKALGFVSVGLEVHQSAAAAVALYRSVGFRQICEQAQILTFRLDLGSV